MAIGVSIILVVVAAVLGYRLGRRTADRRHLHSTIISPETGQVEEAVSGERRTNTEVERALADLRLGVIVVTADGEEVYRNNQAERYATGRHGDALVQAALERVVEGALVGLSLEESVEVYGPPARSLLVQASPTYDAGELSGAVGVIDDVTEARHIDRIRSDFVANVSHELRTPVGALSVLAETIADTEDPEVIDRLTGRMQRETNRLSETIEDLLALSALESGPITEPEIIDLVSVVTMAIERTGEAAQQQGVVVAVENVTGTPILVEGDQGQLVSAVANLLDNAIKYSDTSQGVEVVLSTTAENPDQDGNRSDDRPAELARISVTDFGIGIPDRDLDRIFERFYRVDSARSRETGGTGLGLSIVRNALRNHQGTVDVASTEGQGSTFTIHLPLSAAQDQLSGERAGTWNS